MSSKDDSSVTKHTSHFKRTLMYKLICLFASLTLFVVFFCLAVSFNVIDGSISYQEIGKTDYTVKLLPNDKYGPVTLPSGDNKAYVSSIIEKINPSFNYEVHLNNNINFNYKYTVSSVLYIYNYSDNKELKKISEQIKEESKELTGNSLTFNDIIPIDYQHYSEEVKSYKNYFQLPVTSKLVVTMNLTYTGKDDGFSDSINRKISEQITIPIGESTTDIKIDSKDINDHGELINKMAFKVKNVFFFVLSLITLFLAIKYLILVVVKLYRVLTKDVYHNTLNKILKNYDKVIVTGKIEIR